MNIRGFRPTPTERSVPGGLDLYERAQLRFVFEPDLLGGPNLGTVFEAIEEWLKPFDRCDRAHEFAESIAPPAVTAGMSVAEVEQIMGAPLKKEARRENVVVYRYARYSILFVDGFALQFSRR